MKKSIILMSVILVAFVLVGAGCNNRNNVITPTPTQRLNPTATIAPANTPGYSPAASPAGPNGTGGPNGTSGNGYIEGFREGEVIQEHELPAHVLAAIRDEYPNTTIKSASYATYLNRHMYLVTLEGGPQGTTQVYVSAEGTLTPHENGRTSPNP